MSANPNPEVDPRTPATASTLEVPTSPNRTVHNSSPTATPTGGRGARPTSPGPRRRLFRDKEFINFVIQWTCGIIATAAAIVFGIWAPLSYEATASANSSNDVAQSSMIDALSSATRIARSAATVQSSALSKMEDRLALMGQLAVINFCLTQSVWLPDLNDV